MEKQIKVVQNFDNHPLMSNQQTISHTAERFIIDFQGVVVQFDPNNQPTMLVNHKAVMIDPYKIKGFLDALTENIKKYEEKYGKIKEPEAITKAKKEIKSMQSTPTEKPSYLG